MQVNTKGLSSYEARVMGSINVLGYVQLPELAKESGLPSALVEKQVLSLEARGLVWTGSNWRGDIRPGYIHTANDYRPVREVFHSVNMLYDILRMEANVNSGYELSGALYSVGRIAELRQKRMEVNISNNWKPAITVNKMIFVSEADDHLAKRVSDIIKLDQGSRPENPAAASRATKEQGAHFRETFRSLDYLDAMLRRQSNANIDFSMSGAIYDLAEIIQNRQQGPQRKIVVSEIDAYSTMQKIRSVIR